MLTEAVLFKPILSLILHMDAWQAIRLDANGKFAKNTLLRTNSPPPATPALPLLQSSLSLILKGPIEAFLRLEGQWRHLLEQN